MFSYAVSLGTPASLQDMLEVWANWGCQGTHNADLDKQEQEDRWMHSS